MNFILYWSSFYFLHKHLKQWNETNKQCHKYDDPKTVEMCLKNNRFWKL